MVSTTGISHLGWGIQQNKFTATVRVLKLQGYDIILGMEWLEDIGNGEMWINWRRKKLRFNHEGKRITLRGITDNQRVHHGHLPKACVNIDAGWGYYSRSHHHQYPSMYHQPETTSTTKPTYKSKTAKYDPSPQTIASDAAAAYQQPESVDTSKANSNSIENQDVDRKKEDPAHLGEQDKVAGGVS